MVQRPHVDIAIGSDGDHAKRNRRVCGEGIGMWTEDEHDRFMVAIKIYPNGPWRLVADYVGTRNARQTMTHAQKYKQKLARRQRGLRTPGRTPTRRLRQASVSESEAGSDAPTTTAYVVRPHLPVVIRTSRRTEETRYPSSNDSSFTGSFQALHQANVEDVLSELDDDIETSLLTDTDWFAPLEITRSPRDPSERVEDDSMWIDEYVNLMLHPLECAFT